MSQSSPGDARGIEVSRCVKGGPGRPGGDFASIASIQAAYFSRRQKKSTVVVHWNTDKIGIGIYTDSSIFSMLLREM